MVTTADDTASHLNALGACEQVFRHDRSTSVRFGALLATISVALIAAAIPFMPRSRQVMGTSAFTTVGRLNLYPVFWMAAGIGSALLSIVVFWSLWRDRHARVELRELGLVRHSVPLGIKEARYQDIARLETKRDVHGVTYAVHLTTSDGGFVSISDVASIDAVAARLISRCGHAVCTVS